MREMYLWKVTFGMNMDSVHLVTPEDSIAGAIGAGISYAKERWGYTPGDDGDDDLEITSAELIRDVLVVDLTGSSE